MTDHQTWIEQAARAMALADSREYILATSDASELHHASDAGWKDYLHQAKALVAAGLVGEEHPRSSERTSEALAIDDEDHMVKISELISRLQETKDRFGDTCVYIRRGGLSWGAVALNRRDDDKKHGVFDFQAQHDWDMLQRAEQVERLTASRNDAEAMSRLQTEARLRAEARLAEAIALLDDASPPGIPGSGSFLRWQEARDAFSAPVSGSTEGG